MSQFGFILHRAVSLQQFVSSEVFSFRKRCWLDQAVRSSNNAALTEVTGHTSPYLMKYIGSFQSIGGTVCLATHENILKRTFEWGSIGIQESVAKGLKLWDQFWALSESFTMSWSLQTCLRSVLLWKNARASNNMKYDKKRLLSHCGYVSKFEDKRNIQWWFRLGECPGRVHLHSGLFLFSLSLCCVP